MNECKDLLLTIIDNGFRELHHEGRSERRSFDYEGRIVNGDVSTMDVSFDSYCEGIISGDWAFKHCARDDGNTLTSIKRRFMFGEGYYEISIDNNCTVELTQSGQPLIGEFLVNGRYELFSVYKNDPSAPISELIFDPLFKRFEGLLEDMEHLKVLKEGLRWMLNRDKGQSDMHGIGVYVPTWEVMGFDVLTKEIDQISDGE